MKSAKRVAVVLCVVGAVSVANGEMVILEGVNGETLTTGDLLDGTDNTGITTNVLEIPGLEITARSGAPEQDINVTVGSMGITIFNSGDDTDALEEGEALILSFSEDVRINQFDFNQFASGEVVNVSIDGDVMAIHDLDLSDRGSDYLNTNIVVTAGAEIAFYTTGANTIGLDGIDITLIEGSDGPMLDFMQTNGIRYVVADFGEAASTNYILQSCTNLVSNGWTTVTGSLSGDTNIAINAEQEYEFFRVIIE